MHTQDDIIKDLEQPMISAKINGIKQAILLLLSGETLPRCARRWFYFVCCWVLRDTPALFVQFPVFPLVGVQVVCACFFLRRIFVTGLSFRFFSVGGVFVARLFCTVAQPTLISRALLGVLPGGTVAPCVAPAERCCPWVVCRKAVGTAVGCPGRLLILDSCASPFGCLYRLLMSVIKGCLKEESKELKKLVMMYWEVVKKYDAEGKLLPEMILVRVCACVYHMRRPAYYPSTLTAGPSAFHNSSGKHVTRSLRPAARCVTPCVTT